MAARQLSPPAGLSFRPRRTRSAAALSVQASGAPPPQQVPPALLRQGLRMLARLGAAATLATPDLEPAAAEPAQDHGPPPSMSFRTVFISDIHLVRAGALGLGNGWLPGTPKANLVKSPAVSRGSQAAPLLDFLREVSCDSLYLVGDIIDGWELASNRVHWPQTHSDVIQKLLKKARKGTKVIYLPGNHDEALRDYLQDTTIELGANVVVQTEAYHATADGRRFLVLHGDRCDLTPHVRTNLNYMLKNIIYRLFQWSNRVIKRTRRLLNQPYWSLATTVNESVAAATQLIRNYEEALAGEARYQGVDGCICGHIHHAQLRTIDGIVYANTGDWVDSCTALVEHFDGRLEVLRWLDIAHHFPKGSREPKSAMLDFLA